MSPIGEKVDPNPGETKHFIERIVSRIALEGAILEVSPVGDAFMITMSAPDKDRLAYALNRLSVELVLMARDVRK